MRFHSPAGNERTRRFRDAALPHLDDAYTFAYYLLRNPADAEDAVQECYLRALRQFDRWRGSAVRTWLLAILREVCTTQLVRRGGQEIPGDLADCGRAAERALWEEPPQAPLAPDMPGRQQGAAIRQLIEALPKPFRELIVLRDIHDMSYGEIAEVVGMPVGTVTARLARARALLLAGWSARGSVAQQPSFPNLL